MLLQKPLLDGMEEVPIEASINNQDDDLGDFIPDFVDVDKTVSIELAQLHASTQHSEPYI